ncbi:N-acetyl sugar amidotransferase [Phenylobacterium terrae]|uniref:N-acetyl sugar amidotransferase n=1 Tax=Phenylobacterium terrae TaxID=2665495 RepID=A0ABW4N4W7_9CAUL
MHPRNKEIDFSRFREDLNDPDVLYGLPETVEYCRSCVISNQRPSSAVEFLHTKDSKKRTIHLDADGICDACRFAERKHGKIDWASREAELVELLAKHRRSDGRYDVLVPGSGGKDSVYAAHLLKYKYGMNPLTVTWAPHIYTDWGWRNFQSWLNAGFDNYLMTANPRVHRLLTRLSVENLFHPFQPFMLGQKNLAPKMALLFDIPLVIYGENEAEYGNPIADTDKATRDLSYFSIHDQSKVYLGGVPITELKSEYGLTDGDLDAYLPADPQRLETRGVEVHYLGYYLKWHPQGCYYYAVDNAGFRAAPERTQGTYSKYNSIDDKIDDLHYYTTYVKFGIGRATYDAAQEIRSRDITREEGVALVHKFDGEYPDRFEGELMEYLSLPREQFPVASRMFEEPMLDRDYFMHLADRFRSPHLWVHDTDGWRLRQGKVSNLQAA